MSHIRVSKFCYYWVIIVREGRGACDCGTCLCYPSMNSNLAYRGISCELRPVEEVCVNQDSNDTVSGVYVLCELCVCVYML